MVLEPGRFGRARAGHRVAMIRQGMLTESDSETVAVLALDLFQNGPENRAGLAFDIAKLFQLDGSAGQAANVRRLGPGAAHRGYRWWWRRLAVMKEDSAGGESDE